MPKCLACRKNFETKSDVETVCSRFCGSMMIEKLQLQLDRAELLREQLEIRGAQVIRNYVEIREELAKEKPKKTELVPFSLEWIRKVVDGEL